MVKNKNSLSIKCLDVLIWSIDFLYDKIKLLKIFNIRRFILSYKAKIIFLVEGTNWAIYWVGKYIIENLKNFKINRLALDTKLVNHLLGKNKIIHFGSINSLIRKNVIINSEKSHKTVVSWFHITPNDKKLKLIPYLNEKVDLLHTSNIITKQKLIELGFDKKKIVVIPLGVDLGHFKRFNDKLRIQLKKKYKIPYNKVVVGSFQKDGIGWEEGLKPKLIKGPDVFCEVVRRLKKDLNIHIFLTGPARGYVKNKLKEYEIPYTHIFLDNYLDMVECYNVLDLYIITSRAEGGPKALLEGMATGVPVISTKVGMSPSIINHGINGFLTNIDDVEKITDCATKIIKDKKLRKKIVENGFDTVQKYDWEKISKMYYNNIYKKLLQN